MSTWPFPSNPQPPPALPPPGVHRQQFPSLHQQSQMPGGPSMLSQPSSQQSAQEIFDISEFPALSSSAPMATQPATPGGSSYASTAGLTGTGNDIRLGALGGVREVGLGGSGQL